MFLYCPFSVCLNEQYLFHGTRSNSPYELAMQKAGFDPQGSLNSLYGSGCYFAKKASYSHHYAFRSHDPEGTIPNGDGSYFHLMIAEVLCGNSRIDRVPWPEAERNDPKYRQSMLGDLFDSVKGGPHFPSRTLKVDASEMFVLYRSSQILASYIVSYTVRFTTNKNCVNTHETFVRI